MKKKLSYFSLALLAIASLTYFIPLDAVFAQTASLPTKLPALALQGITSPAGTAWVTLPNGTVAQADLTGLVLDIPATGRPVLRAVATAQAAQKFNVTPTPVSGQPQSYNLPTLPDQTTVVVHRDGIRMKPAADYTIAGGTITFVAYWNNPNPVVLVDYNEPR